MNNQREHDNEHWYISLIYCGFTLLGLTLGVILAYNVA